MSRKTSTWLTGENWVPHRAVMLASPAWRALSLSARMVLDRLEIEHLAHASTANGKLICTFDNLVDHGVSRSSVRPAIDLAEALGFIEVVVRGRRSYGIGMLANQYRLTYVPVERRGRPTDEWRRLDEQAVAEAVKRLTPPKKIKRVSASDAPARSRVLGGALAGPRPADSLVSGKEAA